VTHLTIAYFTSRKNPAIHWFFDSLRRETSNNFTEITVLVIDFWMQPLPHLNWTSENVEDRRVEIRGTFLSFMPADSFQEFHTRFVHVAPKSCVWQGVDKLTKVDWFAASNARNTAVCLAPDGWIAFVDDVSVLLPGWLKHVRFAMAGDQKTVTLGAYRKVKDLVVEDGKIVSFTDHPGGHDNRFAHGKDDEGLICGGNWLYGCSLAAPVQAFLDINGWPEAWCDGLSFEDCIAGCMLEKKGYTFRYVRSMMTFESEEMHNQLPVMKRSDYGVSPNDKSHAVLHMAKAGNGWHPNYFGEEGIAGLRRRVLAGDKFPIVQCPEHEWFTATPLCDL
jgi:hypothetical protein